MADFEAPSGPPPPKVPEGWIARWNDQYKEWFYINKYTKKSQWDRPTEPVYPPNEDGDAPPGPPPAYRPGDGPAPTDTKTNPFAHSATSTPNPHGAGPSGADDEDARLARQLQAEEDAKARGSTPGSANSYLNSPTPPSSNSSAYPEQLPPRPGDNKDRGLFGKIFGKNKQQGQPGYAPQQPQYGYQNRPPQQYGYGPPPPQQYGYGPPPGQYYQGTPPGGYYQQGYAPQQQYGRPSGGGGGMGMMGGAALGLGAGLIGGALIENAIDNHDEQVYDQGYNAGADDGGGGGDFDGGGGDF